VKTLHSKCSKCENLLVYDENRFNSTVFFYCPNCEKQEMLIKGGNYKYSQYIIEREIKRKAKIGKYQKVN
jgi:Zn finger protein HypA/HybF involved in hydrogenase expression